MIKNVFLSFIPLFVAMDAIGVIPIFAGLTRGLTQKDKTGIILQAMLTAALLALGFVAIGRLVFSWLGISIGDFMIAGGAILFCLAIVDILSPTKERRVPGEQLGVVPLGTPLIVGPAVLTTSMLSVSQYGLFATAVSVAVNILLAGLILRLSSGLTLLLGDAGSKALSKITSLLLAAIAVMLIRKGLEQVLLGR